MNALVEARRAAIPLKDPQLFRDRAYVDGQWAEADSRKRFDVDNPADGAVIGAVPDMGAAETRRAIEAANAALPAWRALPAKERSKILRKWFDLIVASADDLALLLTTEQGKPLAEAKGEILYGASFVEWFAEEAKRVYGDVIPSPTGDRRLIVIKQPIGVVAAITPWNFPNAMITRKVAPGLAVGCTVVLKPAEQTPFSALALAELAERAGFPKGVLNIVTGSDAPAIGKELCANPTVRKLTFTGSTEVGRKIGALAGEHLQTACLELGGKNPMVVTPSADLDLAVEGALFAGFGTAGQRCTSLGTVIVHESVHDEFLRRYTAAVKDAAVGDPAGDVVMGPLLDQKFADRYEEFLTWVQPHHTVIGATGRIGADNPREGFTGGDPADGLFYHPVVVDGVRPGDAIFDTETFGPLVGIATYTSFDEAIQLANAPGYGLSSAIYTNDPKEVFAFRRGISAGMVSVNNSTSGAEAHLPFGGNGKSGNGSRQSGMWVLDQFTRWQSMNWDYSGKLQKAQMDVAELVPDSQFQLS